MLRFIVRKVAYLIPVLLAVTALTFLLIKLLPGDPAINVLAPSATQQAVDQIDTKLGLHKPLVVQYVDWVGRAVTGDLGQSYQNDQTTASALKQRLPVTLELLFLSQLLALAVSVPMAILAARRPNGLLDRLSTGAAFGFLSVPNFILGVVLVLLFAVKIHWFGATGYVPLTQKPLQNLRSLVLPSVTLAVAEMATYLRLLRTDMIATLQEDFVMMAKSKGLSDRAILLRHALRPSSCSLVTVGGLNLGRHLVGPPRQPPGAHFWFGTDENGRDMLSRTIYGARVSLMVGFASIFLGLVIGGGLGVVAGYYQGRIGTFIMGCMDVMLAFPALVFALVIVTFLGASLLNVTVAIAVISIPQIARIIRASTLTFAEREFVMAARTLGAKNWRIITREILPNVILPAASFVLIAVALAIVGEGTLAFLGLSVPAPQPTWGGMINEGRTFLEIDPYISLIPAAAMFVTVLAFNFAGDSLRAFFDVKEGAL
jgi:peptide/nickel transport system permease protein